MYIDNRQEICISRHMYVFLNHDLSVLNHLGQSWLARMCDVVWQCECCRVVGRSKNMGDRKSQGQGFSLCFFQYLGFPMPPWFRRPCFSSSNRNKTGFRRRGWRMKGDLKMHFIYRDKRRKVWQWGEITYEAAVLFCFIIMQFHEIPILFFNGNIIVQACCKV